MCYIRKIAREQRDGGLCRSVNYCIRFRYLAALANWGEELDERFAV